MVLAFMVTSFGHVTRAAEVIELPDLGSSAGALVSDRKAFQIGQSFFWHLQQSTPLVEDPQINAYLQSLGMALVAQSDVPAQPFQFFMVPHPTINAFAAPGGFIGTHSGLLLNSETEDELASVLSHEIAHISQRHLLRRFEQSEQMNVPLMVAMVAAALLGVADPQMGSAAIMAVQAAGVQLQLAFSRDHEREADNIGMHTLVGAGFNPDAMPVFFERLDKASRFYQLGNDVPEFLRTHPVTLSRIADARGRAVTYPASLVPRDQLLFSLMRERIRVQQSDNLTDLLQHYVEAVKLEVDLATPKAAAMRYGQSYTLLKLAQYGAAREALTGLLAQDDAQLNYQLLQAEIESTAGNNVKALEMYAAMLALFGEEYSLVLPYAKILMRTLQPQQAIDLLKRQLSPSTARLVYQLLAQAAGDSGDIAAAHRWLAEHYYSLGRLAQTSEQLHMAAAAAKGDEFMRAKISARLRQVDYARETQEMER